MPFIVQIIYTTPSMNTRSKKRNVLNPAEPNFGHSEVKSLQYFFTLPNTLDDNSYVHLVQENTSLFDLQDLDHQDILNHKAGKRRLAEMRANKRREKVLEKVVGLNTDFSHFYR